MQDGLHFVHPVIVTGRLDLRVIAEILKFQNTIFSYKTMQSRDIC